MSRYQHFALVALLLLSGACSRGADPVVPLMDLGPGAAFLTTDAAAYEMRQEGSVRALDFELTYRNPFQVRVAVPACHSPTRPVLEKLVDGEWVYAFAPVQLMCITGPLVIPAGGTHRFRYELRAQSYDLERWPRAADGSLGGVYRFRWMVGTYDPRTDNGVGAPLPLGYQVSNTFRIRSAVR